MKISSRSQLLAIIAVGARRGTAPPDSQKNTGMMTGLGRVGLGLVDGRPGLGHPEAVGHPGPLNGISDPAEHRGVVEPGPGQHPGKPGSERARLCAWACRAACLASRAGGSVQAKCRGLVSSRPTDSVIRYGRPANGGFSAAPVFGLKL